MNNLNVENALDIWQKTIEHLKNQIDDISYNDLFSNTKEVFKVKDSTIWIIVDSIFTKFRIDKFYKNGINEFALNNFGCHFAFIDRKEAEEQRNKVDLVNTTQTDIDNSKKPRSLLPEYSFYNFVIGESNRFAFLAATKVANDPIPVLNPLYIFGGVGLGKTHLMFAVGNEILQIKPDTNVVYTTAQQYAQDYFTASSSKDPKAFQKFYDYYQSADVLLVDDIQFLEQKTKTQEEFFKLFELLYTEKKKMVVASDRPANQLQNFMDRLKSRLSYGLAVDIKKPDKQLRLGILQKKLPTHIPNPEDVPLEVLELIAEIYEDRNVRELEGALSRYIWYCVSGNLPFTKENVYPILKPLVEGLDKEGAPADVKVRDIKEAVASYYQVSIPELESGSRKAKIVFARQMAVYLIRTLYDLPLKQIGSYFGNRDHATISYSIDKIEKDMKQNKGIKQDALYLTNKIQGEKQ